MKFAILNDTHACIRNASDIFMNYQERFYTEVFFPYLLENDIKHIVHLGDYFDNRKFVNIKALNHHRYVFLKKLRDYGITMDLIPGNHDVYYKNTNDVNSIKELLGHYMNEINIIMEPRVMDYDGMKMALIPWINETNEPEVLEFIKNCKADIVGAHLELQGFEVYKGINCPHGMDGNIFSKFERVLSGHFHTKSEQGNITYLGSQMEFFWNDAGDAKYFHIFDTNTRELTPIRNPITLFEKLYYDDTSDTDYETCDLDFLNEKFVKVIVVNKSDPYMFERFIDRINNRKILELKIAENFSEFMGENVQDESIDLEDTETLLDTYIDAVETELDKTRIKTEVRDLMHEAQALSFV